MALVVAAMKDPGNPKRVGLACRLWFKGDMISAEASVLQPGDIGVSRQNGIEAGIAQAMIMGLQCASELVAEDNVAKHKAIMVGRGTEWMLKFLGAGLGDVPVQIRCVVATRWHEIRRLVKLLVDEEVSAGMADRSRVDAEKDVVLLMAKAQVCGRDTWNEPKTFAWTEEHKKLPELPAEWPTVCPCEGCVAEIMAVLRTKWVARWNQAHLGEVVPALVRELAPGVCRFCKVRFNRMTAASTMERHLNMCVKNPKNSSCRDTETSGVEIVRNQRGLGVRHQQQGVDDDGEADEGEGVKWKHAAFENVDWEVVCRFRGRLVGEVPRVSAPISCYIRPHTNAPACTSIAALSCKDKETSCLVSLRLLTKK
jgi:hypothetical protein